MMSFDTSAGRCEVATIESAWCRAVLIAFMSQPGARPPGQSSWISSSTSTDGGRLAAIATSTSASSSGAA
jgi:hypothetical protein